MKIVTVEEFFIDAPSFRRHEGFVGAKYHIKDPRNSNASGLWFPKEAAALEIATYAKIQTREFIDRPANREAARRNFDFRMVDVQPGDAVHDYYLSFKGSRDGWDGNDRGSDWYQKMSKAERDNGALIQFHIPKDEFQQNYVLDEIGYCYRGKPYRMKFTHQDILITMPHGGAPEQVPAFNEVRLVKGALSMTAISVFSGTDERMIAGQPLEFYLKELHNLKKEQHAEKANKPLDFDDISLLIGSVGMGLSYSTRSGEKPRNPYASFREMYRYASGAFNKAGMLLSPEQQGEFTNHMRDIDARYNHFEHNPPVIK